MPTCLVLVSLSTAKCTTLIHGLFVVQDFTPIKSFKSKLSQIGHYLFVYMMNGIYLCEYSLCAFINSIFKSTTVCAQVLL